MPGSPTIRPDEREILRIMRRRTVTLGTLCTDLGMAGTTDDYRALATTLDGMEHRGAIEIDPDPRRILVAWRAVHTDGVPYGG